MAAPNSLLCKFLVASEESAFKNMVIPYGKIQKQTKVIPGVRSQEMVRYHDWEVTGEGKRKGVSKYQ